MRYLRTIPLIVGTLVLVLAACAGGGASSPSVPPSPDGGPVTTPEQAVERVVAREPRLAGIAVRDPDMIGQASWYEVVPASGVGAFLVTVRIGWGDCQAGCIDEHTWVYAVLPDGTVTLQSEGGDEVPGNAWPSPGAVGGGGASGVAITAVAGPTCPVESVPPDPNCAPRPVAGAVVSVQDAQGNTIGTVVLDAAGSGFVDAPAGAYVIVAEPAAGLMGTPEPQKAVVEAGRATAVSFVYDTGIR